jgi:hypothetical protein
MQRHKHITPTRTSSLHVRTQLHGKDEHRARTQSQ